MTSSPSPLDESLRLYSVCDEPESEHVHAASASNESLSTRMNMQDPVETENTVVWPSGKPLLRGGVSLTEYENKVDIVLIITCVAFP